MLLLTIALATLAAAAWLSWLARGRVRLAALIGAAGPVCALSLSAAPLWQALFSSQAIIVEWARPMPMLAIQLGLDALSAFFLLILLVMSVFSAVFAVGYLGNQEPARGFWPWLNLLVASLVLVFLARHAIFFLMAWEMMALCSFFLVAHHHERRDVRQASWTYLIATRLGGIFLIPLFFILASGSGSFEFGLLGRGLSPGAASVCFALAILGFGTKAGIAPLHVWLPEAHPAAPSPISALLSGVMIKTGIYGLIRCLTFLSDPPSLAWGCVLITLGGLSALLGGLFALAQRDLKRLLAYCSVENIGLIVLSLGVSVMGLALSAPRIAALGMAGALLHVLHHALFKGGLFLSAGAILHATGTTEMDKLGGLLRRMPTTGWTFAIFAVAIAALPPFNGFISELLIYWAAFSGALSLPAPGPAWSGLAVLVLAAVGGLALASFTMAFGVIFLGHPRGEANRAAHEAPASMRWPMLVLAGLCLTFGLAGACVVPALSEVVKAAGVPYPEATLRAAGGVLARVSLVTGGALALLGLLAGLRGFLLRGREVRASVTWDCGYAVPAATMQYTGSSFVQPIVDLYQMFLRTRKKVAAPEIHFPDAAHVETETPDIGREGIYEPLFERVESAFRRLHVLQQGRVQIYVLGVVLTLIVLLLTQVR
ncbi:MAG: hypothetical protein MUF51_04920 [Vicinamibacteria bacterium]|nr:hypothetical protein [Vicinamibacteria bacterium]